MNLLLVFIGGGLGSAARYGMSLAALRLGWIAFPYATLATNVIGCFVMGLITELLALKFSVSQPTRLFLTTGIVGGFTTFSTFALETALHVEQGASAPRCCTPACRSGWGWRRCSGRWRWCGRCDGGGRGAVDGRARHSPSVRHCRRPWRRAEGPR